MYTLEDKEINEFLKEVGISPIENVDNALEEPPAMIIIDLEKAVPVWDNDDTVNSFQGGF